ncbi:MAG TPA: DUF4167 domain-containing protein [Paracoccus sp. (in: a-proteobacteria)]|nr:DUF4167 domain-containing protein [Paracoccus sp. (in: a-proteobacteria)]
MRSSKSRSRNKSRNQRSLGNVVNRVFDSSGPEGKVRGTPQQIIEKYLALARDAQLSNDRVAEQSFFQHAEHYTRMLGEAQREQAERQAQFGQGDDRDDRPQGQNGNGHSDRGDRRDDQGDDRAERRENRGERRDDRGERRDDRGERRDNRREDRRDNRRPAPAEEERGAEDRAEGNTAEVQIPVEHAVPEQPAPEQAVPGLTPDELAATDEAVPAGETGTEGDGTSGMPEPVSVEGDEGPVDTPESREDAPPPARRRAAAPRARSRKREAESPIPAKPETEAASGE